MRSQYLAGNYGYGHAKQAFYELILEKYAEVRSRYQYYMVHKSEIDQALQVGAEKARRVAQTVLKRVRTKLGY